MRPILSVDLPPALAADIRTFAAASAPHECCGLLEGRRKGDVWHVMALHPAANLAARADRFQIDPAAQFAAQRQARAAGHRIIGCYHSHPGGRAEPSATDLAGAAEPDFLWLIATRDAIGAFAYLGGEFVRVTGAD